MKAGPMLDDILDMYLQQFREQDIGMAAQQVLVD